MTECLFCGGPVELSVDSGSGRAVFFGRCAVCEATGPRSVTPDGAVVLYKWGAGMRGLAAGAYDVGGRAGPGRSPLNLGHAAPVPVIVVYEGTAYAMRHITELGLPELERFLEAYQRAAALLAEAQRRQGGVSDAEELERLYRVLLALVAPQLAARRPPYLATIRALQHYAAEYRLAG